MKTLKLSIIALILACTFQAANAQVRVGVNIGTPPPPHRTVIVERRPVVVQRRPVVYRRHYRRPYVRHERVIVRHDRRRF